MLSHAMDDVLDPVLQQFYLSSSSHSSSVLKVPNKSGSRHNVEGSFLCVLYFGWPNQPSSGTMIILHWYVIFVVVVVDLFINHFCSRWLNYSEGQQ